MSTKKSILVPITIVIIGVLLQIDALGLLGSGPMSVLDKLWPLLILVVAADLVFSEHRLVGGLVIAFTGLALLSTQFLETGWGSDIWKFFLNFWPILVILYGVDCIFSGQDLLNGAVIIAVLIVAVYAILMLLDVPFMSRIPRPLDLSGILDSAQNHMLQPGGPQAPGPQPQAPISFGKPSQGGIAYEMPEQVLTEMEFSIPGGSFSLKGIDDPVTVLSGKISGKYDEDVVLDQYAAAYMLTGKGSRENWDLKLSTAKQHKIRVAMQDGYIKTDLRGLSLYGVELNNAKGQIDLMAPVLTSSEISVTAQNGDVRIYVPKGGAVLCHISGTTDVTYPAGYYFSGMTIGPYNSDREPVNVNVSATGSVSVIEQQ